MNADATAGGSPTMMDKAPDAYRTISEAAEELELQQHVLRFWETRFSQIKPLKRSGGRRYYRPEDVDFLRGIKQMLHGDRYTIQGVQKVIKDRGARFVIAIGRDPSLVAALLAEGGEPPAERPFEAARPQAAAERGGLSLKDREKLQSALFELMECKRLLAGA
jgi:DNA-binding transcriptional MerR regulator